MSRLRTAVIAADVSSTAALGKIVGRRHDIEKYFSDFSTEMRWNVVEVFIMEREYSAWIKPVRDVDYGAVLRRACQALNVEELADGELVLERRLVEAFIKRVESSPGFDRTRVDHFLRQEGGVNGAALAGTFATGGLMALLSAGGFGTFVAMSSALGAATGVLGITLPFAAYATASTALSVALGPIGWIGLGVAALFAAGAFRGPNKEREAMELAVLCVWCASVMASRERYLNP